MDGFFQQLVEKILNGVKIPLRKRKALSLRGSGKEIVNIVPRVCTGAPRGFRAVISDAAASPRP